MGAKVPDLKDQFRQLSSVTAPYPLRVADINSRFIRAMFSKEIPLGHSTSQAPVLVQFPKPSSSIG